jgi:V/A-type H+/Na+-transporting ATPase subunit E
MNMTRTLGDITNELKEKVLSPAKVEAERTVGEARSQADKIILEAEREAVRIKEKAKKDAEQTIKQMELDLSTSARNFILLVQERLEGAIVRPVVEEEIKSVLQERDFLSSTVEIVVEKFVEIHGRENNIELLLPDQHRKELEEWFLNRFMHRSVKGLQVHFTDKFSFGFKLSFDDTGAYFNFGDGLVEVFSEFCSPRFRKYFFMAN